MFDRIEAGTYMTAVAATGGELLLKGANVNVISSLVSKLTGSGASIHFEGDQLLVTAPNRLKPDRHKDRALSRVSN
jgi:UDP-N-acetylglucosamine 1-carboxyvinyltransferase